MVRYFKSILYSSFFWTIGYRYDIKHVIGDGAKSFTVAKNFEFPHCRRLMCWDIR